MGTQQNAIYKVHNGVDFDEMNFKTIAEQVKTSDGSNVEVELSNRINKSESTLFLKLAKCNELAGSYTVLEFYVSGSVTDNPTSIQSLVFDDNKAAQTLIYDSLIIISAAYKKVKFYVSGDVRSKFTEGNGYWIYRRKM